MGPGIFTKYAKPVLGGLVAVFVAIAAVLLYFQFRGTIGKESPFQSVNQYVEDDMVSFTAEQETYPVDVETIAVTIGDFADERDSVPVSSPWIQLLVKNNDNIDGWALELQQDIKTPDKWLLETCVDGVWYSMRTFEDHISLDYPEYDQTDSGPRGIEIGYEQTFLCNIAKYYETPLEPGTYRIVFPDMTLTALIDGGVVMMSQSAAMAVEFEVE